MDFPIRGEDEHLFADLYIDVGKRSQYFGSGDVAHLLAELIAPLRDEVLPQPLHHFDPFRGFGKLTFGWGQNTFQPDDDQIPGDQRTNFVRAKTFLITLDSAADRVFTVYE